MRSSTRTGLRYVGFIALFLLFTSSAVQATGLGQPARAKAEAWVGRDASDLLMQLRVDGGRVRIQEDDRTLETRYTWSTNTPAWTEKVYVSGGELLGVRIQNNAHIPEYAPTVYDLVDHPVEHRCDVTYIADSEGVVRRWEHAGPHCDDDIVGPRPTQPHR